MLLSKIYRRYKRYAYLISKLVQNTGKTIVIYTKYHPIYTSVFEETEFARYKFVYINISEPLNSIEQMLCNKAKLIHLDAANLNLDMFPGKPIVVECEGLPSQQILTHKRIGKVFIESLAAAAPLGRSHPELELLYPAVHKRVVSRAVKKDKTEPVTLLTVGYGSMVKGFDVTWKIYETLKDKYPIKLIIAGTIGHNYQWYPEISREAYDKADFPAMQAKIQNDTNVQLGPVRRERLYGEIYPASDIYLHFCRLETFGYSILEAMSFGLPVVANNVRAIPEMVVPGKTGFLVNDFLDDMNSKEWFDKSYNEGLAATIQLLENPELRMQMGINATARIQQQFSLEGKRAILEKAYETLLPGK